MIKKADSAQPEKKSVAPDRDVTGPRSLMRLLGMFDVLSLAPNGLSLAELNATLDSPKSSLLNLLRPLVAEGYLIHSAGAYRLGPSIFRLASGVLSTWKLPKLIHPFLEELVVRTGETALLALLNRETGEVIFADVVDSPHPVRLQVPVGITRPLYASPSGWVLLTYADRAWREQYLGTVQMDFEMPTPVTRASLSREMTRIRADGVSSAIDTATIGVGAVVAPILDAVGQCVGAICIAGPSDRFRHDLDALKAAAKEVAAKASESVAGAGSMSIEGNR